MELRRRWHIKKLSFLLLDPPGFVYLVLVYWCSCQTYLRKKETLNTPYICSLLILTALLTSIPLWSMSILISRLLVLFNHNQFVLVEVGFQLPLFEKPAVNMRGGGGEDKESNSKEGGVLKVDEEERGKYYFSLFLHNTLPSISSSLWHTFHFTAPNSQSHPAGLYYFLPLKRKLRRMRRFVEILWGGRGTSGGVGGLWMLMGSSKCKWAWGGDRLPVWLSVCCWESKMLQKRWVVFVHLQGSPQFSLL